MTKQKRVIAALVLPVLLMALFTVMASAVDTDLIISDFEPESTSLALWSAGDNVRSVNSGAFTPGGGAEYNCLEAAGYDVTVNLARSIRAEFTSALDLTEYRSVRFNIYALRYESDPLAEYYARVTLFSADGGTTENIVTLRPGRWEDVSVDISTWVGRDQVIRAEISLSVSTNVYGSNHNSFFVDDLRASGKIDRELTARFMFDTYEISGGKAQMTSDELKIDLSEDMTTMLEATVFAPDVDWELGMLRLRLKNESTCELLILHYSTFDTAANSEEKILSVKLEPKPSDGSAVMTDYYLDVGDVTKLSAVKLQFQSGSGSVIIDSLCGVSVYRRENVQTCGSIATCKVGDDLMSVRFTGEVQRDEALANQNGRIEIYSLPSGGDIDISSLDSLEPIASSPMTTKFDLTIKLEQDSVLRSRFVVVSRHTDGSAYFIALPRYIDNPERFAASSSAVTGGKKGVAVSDISRLGELGADITIIETSADELYSGTGATEKFTYGGASYYFRNDETRRLGLMISAARGSGADVLIRLTGFDGFSGGSLAEYSYSFDDAPAGDRYLAAAAAYIAEKWCAGGDVSGVILGMGLNFYDRGDGFKNLTELAASDAEDIRAVAFELMSVNSSAKVYASVTDMYSVTLAAGTSEIGLEQYLDALARETSREGDFRYGIAVESFYRLDNGGELVSTKDAQRIISRLGTRKAETDLIFTDSRFDFPKITLGEMCEYMFENYYRAVIDDRIDAYIVVVYGGDRLDGIADYIKGLDSPDSLTLSGGALAMLGIGSWNEVITNFDAKKLPVKRDYTADAVYELPGGTKGSYAYYRFTTPGDTLGFGVGPYCTNVASPTGASAIVAVLDRAAYGGDGGAERMGIQTRFDYPDDYTLTPVVAVTLRVGSVQTASGASADADITDEESVGSVDEIPLRLTFTAGNDRIISDATVKAGEWTTIYVDVGSFDCAKNIDGIRISVGAENVGYAKLSVRDIVGYSRDFADESIESVVADARAKRRSPEVAAGYSTYLWMAGGLLVAVATVMTVVLLSKKKDSEDED